MRQRYPALQCTSEPAWDFSVGEWVQRYRGFSFAEVMFAVAILGVGFIMIASVFPVAAAQTRSTNDEAVAAQIARAAFHTIQVSTTATDYPFDGNNPGITHPFGDGGTLGPWDKVRTSMICPTDRRYAWVPFYSQQAPDAPIRVTVLVVRRSLHDSFTSADSDPNGGELVPRLIDINKIVQGDGSFIAAITKDSLGAYQSVGPGSFLIVTSADDTVGGHLLQVSELAGESPTSVCWRLFPGFGLNQGDSCGQLKAAVIGKEPVDPSAAILSVGGGVQDISVFTALLNPK